MREPDIFDPYDNPDEEGSAEENEVRCKFCRERDLQWREIYVDGIRRNVLVNEDEEVHDCRNRVAKAEEFEELDLNHTDISDMDNDEFPF